MKEKQIEIAILNLKSAVLCKEFINIEAAHDLSKYGSCQCDYNSLHREWNLEITRLNNELKKLMNP
jgi:hypothetical protein